MFTKLKISNYVAKSEFRKSFLIMYSTLQGLLMISLTTLCTLNISIGQNRLEKKPVEVKDIVPPPNRWIGTLEFLSSQCLKDLSVLQKNFLLCVRNFFENFTGVLLAL